MSGSHSEVIPTDPSPAAQDTSPALSRQRLVLNRLPWILLILLSSVHLWYLNKFAVNTAFMDDWEAFVPGNLTRHFNLDWILASHNEHRIVFTKLLAWFQFHIDGFNFRHTIIGNFLIYMGLTVVILRTLLRSNWQRCVFLVYWLSILNYDNFIWAFQNSFHIFILMFMGALNLAHLQGKKSIISALFASGCIFAFGSGIVCAAVMIAFWMIQMTWFNARPREQMIRILVVMTFMGLWLATFESNPHHPALVMPWKSDFWVYFLNIISLGLGFSQSLSLIPGILILGLCLVGLYKGFKDIFTMRNLGDLKPMALQVGAFGCLILITLSRAGFGGSHAKSSRYAEISMLVLPFLLIYLERLMRNYKHQKALWIVVTAVLLGPAVSNYSIRATYKSHFAVRKDSADCIQQYYLKQNSGDCPGYIANLASRLDYARQIGVSFAEPAQ